MKSPVEAGAAGTTAGAETASTPRTPSIVIVGAGPAGLMAAQACVDEGAQVTVFDAMPSVGRKLLLAGKGGLNITHSEPADAFRRRYGRRGRHHGCGYFGRLWLNRYRRHYGYPRHFSHAGYLWNRDYGNGNFRHGDFRHGDFWHAE